VTSQIIGNNALALFLPHDEMEDLGLCRISAEGREMKKLVVDTMRNLGVESEGDMEIEIFNGKQGILIFAVVGLVPMVRYMVFNDLENLIEAVGTLNELPLKSKLTYCQGKYWLELKDFDETVEKVALQLGEYGQHIAADDFHEGVMEEYGTVIEENNAIAKFRYAFHNLSR
jgi:hypothetical protein